VRTAIVSDLHLGGSLGEDLLRDASIRRLLLDEIGSADRLVVLGDGLELRELPLPKALAAARPFFEELGEAMAGREILIIPGNHDHRLAEPLLEAEAMRDGGGSHGLEQRRPDRGVAQEVLAEGAAQMQVGDDRGAHAANLLLAVQPVRSLDCLG
jgi:DNA repair exonuclease SbcCD nuclease subunit